VRTTAWLRNERWWGGREQTRWTGSAGYVALHAYQDQAAATRNEISKWCCRSLPAAGRQAGWGWWRLLPLLQLHWGDWTALRCDRCVLLQRSLAAERQRVMFHCINWLCLSALCPGRRHRPWLLALRFRLSYEYFFIQISGPKFDIRISGYRLTTLIYTVCLFTSYASPLIFFSSLFP